MQIMNISYVTITLKIQKNSLCVQVWIRNLK